MKLSTRVKYATRALLDLALHQGEEPVLLKDIAHRQQISLRYLEHIITPLVATGLLLSTRGPKGGVSLAKSPEEIKLSEVIQLLEGSIAPVECVNNPKYCSRSDSCVTRDVWDELKQPLNEVWGPKPLKTLVGGQKKRKFPE